MLISQDVFFFLCFIQEFPLTRSAMSFIGFPTERHLFASLCQGLQWCRAGAKVQTIGPLGKCCGPYFGGGGGLGAPVVSYAPRPMLLDSFSLEIIVVLVGVSSTLYVSTWFHVDFKFGNANVTG